MSAAGQPSPPAKVCHVFCGAEGATWMVEQLRELRRRHGYEVHAVVSAGQGALIDKLKAERIPFSATPFVFSVTQPYAIVRATILLARLLRRERFDVVQSHVFWSAFLARPAAWLADVRVRLAMIAGPYHLQAFSSRWVDRSTAWMETALIPSCRKSFDLYRAMGVPAERLTVIYYGADSAKFDPARTAPAGIRAEYGWPEDTPVIVLVAYFYPPQPPGTWTPPGVHGRGIKGHDLFIKAASFVIAEFPRARFVMVGNDWEAAPYRQQLEYMVRELKLEDSVIFAGYRADVNQILREADVAVQASRNENLGGTIEALLMQCPMVVTRVGGMPDTVRDRETGILVNPADPADLARGILELLRDPAAARGMARNGRELMIREFSLQKTVEDLDRLYTRLLAERPRRSRLVSGCISAYRLAIAPFAAAYCVCGLAAIRRTVSSKRRARLRAKVGAEAARARQAPAPVPGPAPPIHAQRATLIHCNLPKDIVPEESVRQLHQGGPLPSNGLYLGLGWHGLERDQYGAFRWLRSGGELIVSRPDGGERTLVLDVQAGPGRFCSPFQVRLVDETGAVAGTAMVRRRRGDIQFRVRPRAEGAGFLLEAPSGVPMPFDWRILNLCVRRISWQLFRDDIEALRACNLPEDIVPKEGLDSLHSGAIPEAGILLGRGWRPLESDGAGLFRSIRTEAELVIAAPIGSSEQITLDIEPWPHAPVRALELQLVNEADAVIARAVITGRREIAFRLPPATQARTAFWLVADDDGYSRLRNRVRTAFRLLRPTPAATAGRSGALKPRLRVRRIARAGAIPGF